MSTTLTTIRAALAALVGLALLVIPSATPSRAAAEPSVTFGALADIGNGPNSDLVLRGLAAGGTSHAFAVGDLSYAAAGTESTWCSFVTARVGTAYPFELLSGNHESNGYNGSIDAFAGCLPDRLSGLVGTYGKQYYVDVPADAPLVRYVMISPGLTYPDGYWDYSAGTARYTWTADAIDGARSKGIPWVVVGMHKPCLSIGGYGCDAATADITNLLVSRKVDLVLHGHEHLYQRTKQLRLSATSCSRIAPGTYASGCVADADNDLVKGAGTVDVTVGTGGVTLRDVVTTDSEAGYFAASSGANRNPTHGFLKVTATDSALSASFIGVNGTFTDTFRIAEPVTTTTLVRDGFDRTVSSGLGSASIGGAWTASAGTSVSSGMGRIALSPGTTRTAHLAATSLPGVDLRGTLALDRLPSGNGVYATVLGRRVAGVGDYRASLRLLANGVVAASLGTDKVTVASSVTAPGVSLTAGERLLYRMRVSGSSPTTVSLKVWESGQAEPSTWLRTMSDGTPGLQTSGSTGLTAYLSSSATAPVTLGLDDWVGTTP